MAPPRRKYADKATAAVRRRWKVGDLVLAKVKGFSSWPATLSDASAENNRRELERTVLDTVGHVISSVNEAKHVDQVIVALYSLAVRLFPLHPHSISGSVDEKYRDKLFTVELPCGDEKTKWWNVFYRGSSFTAFSRVLLYDISTNWLPCFPASARKHVYDVFFISGCATEIVQAVVPCLQLSRSGGHDSIAVCSNAERSWAHRVTCALSFLPIYLMVPNQTSGPWVVASNEE